MLSRDASASVLLVVARSHSEDEGHDERSGFDQECTGGNEYEEVPAPSKDTGWQKDYGQENEANRRPAESMPNNAANLRSTRPCLDVLVASCRPA